MSLQDRTTHDRLPPIAADKLTAEQKQAAAEFQAGRGVGVLGPFSVMLRSPEVMLRAKAMGDYLRFRNVLDKRVSEMVILITAREWTQQFEWFVHLPLARKAGIAAETAQALEEGRRPAAMAQDESIAWDFSAELLRTRGVSETTYQRAVAKFGDRGVIDMLGVLGYFTTVSMVMNVAHSPAQRDAAHPPLAAFPL
jgi:4-carboxymuconolactone decarboxylase